MANLTDRAAYLRGLAEGMGLDKEKNEHKLLLEMLGLMDEMAQKVSDLDADVGELEEYVEDLDSDLSDMTITTEMLEEADTLKDMNLPKGTLVMIVKRGDEFLIPNGTLKLHVGDKLLLISEKSKEEVNESE